MADPALELLERSGSVCNVILLEGAARKPDGDVILCDVAREDASVIIEDLKEIGDPARGLDLDGVHRHPDLRRGGAGGGARAGPALGRGHLGGRGEPQRGDDRALAHVHGLHGDRDADRGGGHPARPADPDRGRDGGGAGVRAARRPVRGDRGEAPDARAQVAPGAGGGLSRWESSRPWGPPRSSTGPTSCPTSSTPPTIRSPTSSPSPTSSRCSWPSWRAWPGCSRSPARSRAP